MCVYHASLQEMETGILYRRSFSCHAAFRFVYGAASNRGIKEHYDSYLPCFAFYPPSVCVLLSYYKDTKIGEYISALTKMHMPSEVVIPLAVMFRFVPTIQEEWQMVNQALRLRGLAWNWRNVLTRPVHMLEYMMVPFLMQCSVVVDEMSAAVMARGFDRDTRRSSYIEVKLSILDWCIITVSAGILAWNLIV